MRILDRFRLDEQVVVVTGGTGLYGVLFCRALAQAGATVVVTSRTRSRAESVARQVSAEGTPAVGLELDQADPDSVSSFAAQVTDQCGGIDVLINNAVHRQGSGLEETTAADWDATSATNSRGLFLTTQAMARSMAARGGGSIINIGSIYGIVAPTFDIYDGATMTSPLFYSYDKAGMVGFTKYLAAALGPVGIRVNCVCPGGLRSEGQPQRFVDAYVARTPLGRMAGEDDVTGVIVFLASPASAYITGVTVPVDGGWTVH
jgi:NAD(P)-dependent dehydrogenase (short-subunit alcohol dehydrogenase family)